MEKVDVEEVVLSHDGWEVGALHPFHHHQVDKAGQTEGREKRDWGHEGGKWL